MLFVSLHGLNHRDVCDEIARVRRAMKIKRSGLTLMTLVYPVRDYAKVTHEVTREISDHTCLWEAFKSFDGHLILAMHC